MRTTILLCLGLATPSWAMASITVRASSTSGTYQPASAGGFVDVFGNGTIIDEGGDDDVVALAFAPAETGCSKSGGTGTFTLHGSAPYSTATYVPSGGDSGLITITCNSGASYSFRVGNHHRRLFMLEPTNNIWTASIQDFDTNGVLESYFDRELGRVPDHAEDSRWVQATAWEYVLDVALHDVRAQGGTDWTSLARLDDTTCAGAKLGPTGTRDANGGGINIDDGVDSDWCADSGDTKGLLDTGSVGDLRQYRTWLERLAIAAMLDDTAVQAQGLQHNAYHNTLVYWTQALVDVPDWETNLSSDDLARADLIIGLRSPTTGRTPTSTSRRGGPGAPSSTTKRARCMPTGN